MALVCHSIQYQPPCRAGRAATSSLHAAATGRVPGRSTEVPFGAERNGAGHRRQDQPLFRLFHPNTQTPLLCHCDATSHSCHYPPQSLPRAILPPSRKYLLYGAPPPAPVGGAPAAGDPPGGGWGPRDASPPDSRTNAAREGPTHGSRVARPGPQRPLLRATRPRGRRVGPPRPHVPPRGAARSGRPSGASAAGSPSPRTRPLWCRSPPPASPPRRAPPPATPYRGLHPHPPPRRRNGASWTSSYLRAKPQQ